MGKAARLTEKATRDIKRALSEDISDGAKAASKAVEGMGVNINRALAGIGAGAVFGMFIKETVSAQNELAQLQAVLKSTGQAAGLNSRQLTDMASQMAKATTHSTGEIINAQTRLLSYSAIAGKEFPRALQLAIDQSVRLGESLTQSAETVGKALEYPAQGVAALTKQGFRFTEEQKKMLKVMEETGRLAEAQALVMGVMEESYEGAAAAARDTLGGALAAVGKSFTDLLGSGSESSGIKAATAAVNGFANNIGMATVVLGGFAAVKASEAVINRTRAITAGMAVERASTKETLLAAQVLERRARVAMLDAQAEAKRAQGTAVQTVMTLQAKEAEMAYNRAVLMTAAAQKQATAAAAGLASRGLQAISGLLGGPVGIAAMVATTAAGWLLFRDNTNAATRAIDDMTGSLGDAIAKYRELDQLQRAGAIAAMADKVADAADEVREEVAQMMRDVRQILASEVTEGGEVTFLFGKEARDSVYQFMVGLENLTAEYKAGEITARQFNDQVQAQKEQLLQSEEVARTLGSTLAKQGSEVGEATTKHQELTDKLAAMQGKMTDAEIAARGLAGGVRDLADAANIDFSKIDKQLESMIQSSQDRYIEATLGKTAMLRTQLERSIGETGASANSPEAQRRRELLGISLALDAASEAANKNAAANQQAAKAAEAAGKQRRESLARYTEQAELAAAALSGPLDEAQVRHVQAMVKLNDELAKGKILQGDANVLMAESAAAYAKVAQGIEEAQNAPNALLDTMTGEIRLLGMTGQARELYRRQLENERDMREAINRANDAGAGINDEVTQSLLRQARGWAETSIAVEEATANAQAWQGVVMGAVGGAADMFADLFSGGIKGTKDFFSELKDIWKRGWWDILRTAAQQNFVNPLQKALAGMMSGQGYAGAGQSGGGWMSQLFGSGKSGGMLETIGGWFGMGGGQQQRAAAAAGGPAWNGMSGAFGWGNAAASVAGVAGGGGGGGAGDIVSIGGQLYTAAGSKAGAGFMQSAAAPWLAGAAGAVYGWKQGGDTTGKALGAAAYGAAGYGVMAGVGGAMAGSAVAGSAAAGLAAVPVVGWIALAAIAIDKLSGGKLFGTKYQAEQVTQTIGIGPDGGMASASVYERGQKSLFGGVKRRDRNIDPSQEMLDAADEIYDAMEAVAKSVSSTLGIATVDVISGSFKQVYDKKGKLVSEGSTVLGKMYSESVEDFARRLSSEQVIAAVGKIDASASKIAEDWRHSAEVLEAGAAFFMAAAGDARNGLDLWTGVGLQGLTDFVTRMQTGEEAMLATYQRLAGLAGDYGNLMADINTQLLTGDLNTWQQQALAIERTYRQQTKSANDYAKALGLTGARAEDLAKIEELRAVGMGKLQAQMEAEKAASLSNLALSDLSPLRDDQKLAEAMKQLQDAVSAGDIGAANSASQAALGFGRNLYASGKDYNALYQQVTGMIGGMQLGDLALEDGTTMGELADTLEALPEQFGKAIFELAAGMQKETTAATNEVRDAVNRGNALLEQVLEETRKGVGGSSSERLRKELNRQEVAR